MPFQISLSKCFAVCVSLLSFSAFGAEPIRVVVTHSLLAEFVGDLGGDAVQVSCLVQAGVDPHTFNPKPSDVRDLSRAALVVAVGFELEPYLERLVRNSGTKARVIQAGSAIVKPVHGLCRHHAHGEGGAHDGDEIDPHWWHSVRETRAVVVWLAGELGRLVPSAKEKIEARLSRRIRELDSLESWALKEISRVPVARRKLVTTHDAFGYFARDYGFERIALLSTTPEAEAEARTLAAVIARIRRDRIPAVFPDRAENPQVIATMVGESGAKLGDALFADGPGGAGMPAPDYAGMFRHNVRAIAAALAGDGAK